jgi:hypothetical protein
MHVVDMRASTIPDAFLRQVSSRPDDIFVQVWKQHQGVMDEITWKSFALRVSASCAVLTSRSFATTPSTAMSSAWQICSSVASMST